MDQSKSTQSPQDNRAQPNDSPDNGKWRVQPSIFDNDPGDRGDVDGLKNQQEQPEPDKEQRLTVRVPEAARLLGISRSVAYEAVRRGEIPSVRIGRRLLVPLAALERLLSGADKKEE